MTLSRANKVKARKVIKKILSRNTSLRSEIGKYTGKICSYMELGRLDEARQWARILQQKLIELNLLVDNAARPGHNGQQPENTTTKPGPKL